MAMSTPPALPSLFRPHQPSTQKDTTSLVPPLRWHARDPTHTAARSPIRPPPAANTHMHARDAKQKKRQRETRSGRVASHRADATQAQTPSPVRQTHQHEREELTDELRALETQLAQLQRRAGLTTRDDDADIENARVRKFHTEEALHQNDLLLGRLHSMVTNDLLLPAVNTMSSFIHLPVDMAQRRAILRGLQDRSLRRGIDVATAWLHHLDPTLPYTSEETFTSATGEYHCHRLEMHQFPNFPSARALFDKYVEFVLALEFSITETLGQLTLREDTKDFSPQMWNHRILTVAENVGVPEELNVVGFAQFYEHSVETKSPMGVVVHDTVNIDDLFPYMPDKRTCKDVQSVLMVYEVPSPRGSDAPPLVVIKQCSFIVQLVPRFPVASSALRQLHLNCPRWPRSIMQYLHECNAPDGRSDENE